jgi:hypothetical protein
MESRAITPTSAESGIPGTWNSRLLVAEKIGEIIESGTWQLRHPVGPDALPFLGWRNSMTDEEWVELHGADDDTWYRRMERNFGLAIRPKH